MLGADARLEELVALARLREKQAADIARKGEVGNANLAKFRAAVRLCEEAAADILRLGGGRGASLSDFGETEEQFAERIQFWWLVRDML